jgi:hypothetical protein
MVTGKTLSKTTRMLFCTNGEAANNFKVQRLVGGVEI